MEGVDKRFRNELGRKVYAMYQNFMIVENEKIEIQSIALLGLVMTSIIDSFKYILSSSNTVRDQVDWGEHHSDYPTDNSDCDYPTDSHNDSIDEVSGAHVESRVAV